MRSWIALTVVRTDMSLGGFLIEGGLEFVDCVLEVGACTELSDELDGGTHRVEGRNLEDARIIEVHDALVLILLEKRLEYRACLRAVLREDVALSDVVRALAACQCRLVKRNVADQIERV